MNNKLLVLLTICIFVVAIFIRLFKISSYPVGLSIDEVAQGYNAYSILKTGRDEHGKFLPLSIESIGDFKAPVQTYLTAASIYFFGENEFAVRFPTVFLGALTAVLVIGLMLEMKFTRETSVFGGLIAAVSPWSIVLSRVSYDTVTALAFFVAGLYCYFVFLRVRKITFAALAVFLFSISFWSYHAERLFIPIFLILMTKVFWKEFKKAIAGKNLSLPIFTLLLFAPPFLYITFFGKGISARASDLWLTRDPFIYDRLTHGVYKNLIDFIFNNDLYKVFYFWAHQYLNYFDLRLWFWKGLNLTPQGFQDLGYLNIIDLPFFIAGIYSLIKSKMDKFKWVLLIWFLLSPIPGSLTRGDPHPARVFIWLPLFVMIVALGYKWLSSRFNKNYVLGIYLLSLFINTFYFWDVYSRISPKFYSDIVHFGYKEVSIYACENYQKYDKVIITDKYGNELPSVKTIPYIYLLFYCKWDPGEYLTDKKLLNIEFRQPQWRLDSKDKNLLLIGSRWDFPENFDKSGVIKEIDFPNGKVAFYFVPTKNYFTETK